MKKDLGSHEWVLKLRRNQTKEELKFGRLLKKCLQENFPELQHCYGKQVPIRHDRGFYILDFYIGKLKLGFEIDGGYHWSDKQLDKDLKRDHVLSSEKSIIVHHIPNSAVRNNSSRRKLKPKLIEWIKKRKVTAKRFQIKKAALKHGWRRKKYEMY